MLKNCERTITKEKREVKVNRFVFFVGKEELNYFISRLELQNIFNLKKKENNFLVVLFSIDYRGGMPA